MPVQELLLNQLLLNKPIFLTITNSIDRINLLWKSFIDINVDE